jgi:hypothetical protein
MTIFPKLTISLSLNGDVTNPGDGLAPTLKRSEASSQRSTLSRRDRRRLETRQALLDASHTLLASRNLDALSVDQIAMRADVAKGTFYNYFAD